MLSASRLRPAGQKPPVSARRNDSTQLSLSLSPPRAQVVTAHAHDGCGAYSIPLRDPPPPPNMCRRVNTKTFRTPRRYRQLVIALFVFFLFLLPLPFFRVLLGCLFSRLSVFGHRKTHDLHLATLSRRCRLLLVVLVVVVRLRPDIVGPNICTVHIMSYILKHPRVFFFAQ